MSTLQVKNLPADLHGALADRARAEGTTMSELVTRLLRRELSRPTFDEWEQRHAATRPVRNIDIVDALDAVRVEYDPPGVTLVLDASAAVHALLATDLRSAARAHMRGHDLVAPALIDTEVLSALARLERSGQISSTEADAAVAAWVDLPCDRVDSRLLVRPVWEMRHGVRISDAHYIALASAYRVPVLTADARLSRAPVKGVAFLLLT